MKDQYRLGPQRDKKGRARKEGEITWEMRK